MPVADGRSPPTHTLILARGRCCQDLPRFLLAFMACVNSRIPIFAQAVGTVLRFELRPPPKTAIFLHHMCAWVRRCTCPSSTAVVAWRVAWICPTWPCSPRIGPFARGTTPKAVGSLHIERRRGRGWEVRSANWKRSSSYHYSSL